MKVEQRTPKELLGFLNSVEEKYAPDTLYLSGDISIFQEGPKISVVGSRNASEDGLRRTKRLVQKLVDFGAVVVSGLAKGIDTVAHRTAIESGGKTISVLGTPLDTPNPKSNASLLEDICAHYLAVSQFPIGKSTHPSDFVLRNRTMALLSDATVIVEAGNQSGTEHQAWEAIRLGRDLFLLQSLADQKYEWSEKLIAYGAQILNDDNIDAVLPFIPSSVVAHESELAF